MGDLFGNDDETSLVQGLSSPASDLAPLAEALRPKTLNEVIGQGHLLGPDGSIRRLIDNNHLPSLILWGPPGVGKTTIAALLAKEVGLEVTPISAIFTGVAELKKLFDKAEHSYQKGRKSVLFVDEIHRFNKSQQDSFLPLVERGVIILIGATTENPSFALNRALLSRAQVCVLNALGLDDLETLLLRAENHLGSLSLTKEARSALIAMAGGDGRYLLNLVEALSHNGTVDKPIDCAELEGRLQKRPALYDKDQDGHYGLISALHKSVRGSDPDGALYWLLRMLDAGEDPRFLARRLIRMASEDIGLADPTALGVCMAAAAAYDRLGSPEGELMLAQAVVHLSTAPKSNALYLAYKKALVCVKRTDHLPPSLHSINAPTSLMKQLGAGRDYLYDHDDPDGFSGQNHFPDGMQREIFYQPVSRGYETRIGERLAIWQKLREQKKGSCLDE